MHELYTLPVAAALILFGGCAPRTVVRTIEVTVAPQVKTVQVTSTPTPTNTPSASAPESSGDGVVHGWAVLAEKDEYSDVDMTDLPVGYIGIAQMHQVLKDAGWAIDQIHDVREFTRETLRDELDWLAERADGDDVALLYVAAHGRYLRDVVTWNNFFAADWAAIPSSRRLLVIDACQAANYTSAVINDPQPYVSIAAVAGDEYGWSGLEEEGLPIIGGVFTHYFAAAFEDPAADTDGDGFVSVQEAALMAEGQQRTYMHEVVFAVPEFVKMYHDGGIFPDEDLSFPHVVVDDTVGAPLYLALDAYPSPSTTAQPDAAIIAASYWPTEGWRTSTPEAQGMDSQMLADMLTAIQQQDHDIDSVSVIRHGYLVADAYVYPFLPDSKHVIHSCTKSIISALVGIAIEEGYIKGVHQPVLDFFPGRTAANLDSDKEAITLEHVLTMATGLECRDSYLYDWGGLYQMRQSEDWVQFMLDLPMAEQPGTRFEYCNGASFLLSAIIQETTGTNALAFAEEHLFGPLGISDVDWPSNPQGITIGWGDLQMLPHDMAKIGYLYLNAGQWDGEQVVPAAWVNTSTRAHIPATLQDGYGYQWWVDDAGVYMAIGYGGQFIFVVPEQDLVVVFTSDLTESEFYTPQTLLNDFIIPAARSSTPLPENPAGVAALESGIQALAAP